jgi:diguanylate cyclase (GGDEF)-like protein/PAS domain S-box-containing protein
MAVGMNSPSGTSFAQEGFFAMADASPAMIWIAGNDKLCYWFNKGWLDFTGRSQEQEFGNGWVEGVHPDDLQPCVDAYIRHFEAREHFLMEYRLLRHDGEYRWILDSGTPRYDGAGNFEGYNGICFDIHERKLSEEVQRDLLRKLEHQAQTDYLTALPNRGHFFKLADHEVNRVRRYGGSLSLLMLDIDHFKSINDQYGHKAGDLVLITFAETCRATLRDFDLIGRLGGEEFAVLLPQTDSAQAIEAAQRLRLAISEASTVLPDGQSVRITASFGVTSLTTETIDLDGLMQQADRALYSAKRSGRNRVLAHNN